MFCLLINNLRKWQLCRRMRYSFLIKIKGRIYKILRNFETLDMKKFTWEMHLTKDLQLDSLQKIAFLTSVEEEFKTIFEDTVFDNIDDIPTLLRLLRKDYRIYWDDNLIINKYDNRSLASGWHDLKNPGNDLPAQGGNRQGSVDKKAYW